MINVGRFRWFSILIALACLAAFSIRVEGQEADEAAEVEKPAKEAKANKAAEKGEKKEAAKADDQKSQAKEAAIEELFTPVDPVVAAIEAAKPTTPAECLRAAKSLAELGHLNIAKPLLKKVLDAKLTPQQMDDLVAEFGSATFIDLGGKAGLQPEAKQLADAIASHIKAKLEDVKRIEGLITQLQDADVEKRMQALGALQEARQAAIGPLLAVLNDPKRAEEHANVRTVLAGMGLPAREALAAIVADADPKLQLQAILTLTELNNPKVKVDLIEPCVSEKRDPEVRKAAAAALQQFTGRVPTKEQAGPALLEAAMAFCQQRQPADGLIDGRVDIWRWDPEKRQCVVHSGTAQDAMRARAARLAKAAYALLPKDPTVRALYLLTAFDVAAYANGLDKPLDDKNPVVVEAKQLGVPVVNDVLKMALEYARPGAAAAAAQLLGQIGKPEDVLYRAGQPTPLALALQAPDRRVRLAAVTAILRLKPTQPFFGASYVPTVLSYFVATSGRRQVLVGGPNAEQTRILASTLAAAGFETATATSGAEFLRLATLSPDYEMAWIDVSIQSPEIQVLLQQLRREPRTALLRIGLIARDRYAELAERLASGDAMSKAFSRPHDEQGGKWQLEQLQTLAPQEFVPFEERQREAAAALDLLAELAQGSGKLYDLRRVQDAVLTAVYCPKLSIKAIAVLAGMNSPNCQRTLVNVASQLTLPLAVRQAAAKAFRENTQKYGILLTTEEIREQYRRYNASEKLDAPTQHVLSLILDCLEVQAKQ
jgi:CheY-like chemotaxis protein